MSSFDRWRPGHSYSKLKIPTKLGTQSETSCSRSFSEHLTSGRKHKAQLTSASAAFVRDQHIESRFQVRHRAHAEHTIDK